VHHVVRFAEMVKRTLHIGIFLQRQHVSDVSLAGIFPMCGYSSIFLRRTFFLRSIAQCAHAMVLYVEGLADERSHLLHALRREPFTENCDVRG
jgi:hypothetical protein